MRFVRFSIAGLMGAVLTAALGLTALRSASETWAGAALLLTCGVLGLAVVGVVSRAADERAWWLGFALFGWGYLALALWSLPSATKLPTVTGLEAVWTKIGMTVPEVPPARGTIGGTDPSFIQIGHCVWALLGACLGGILASAFFAVPAFGSERQVSETNNPGQSPRIWWRRPAIAGLLGLALVGSVAVFGSSLIPQLWAGLTFFLTCGLLGLVSLGALIGRRGSRDLWLGATLFGWGYMMLAFGWHPFHATCPYLVTGLLLDSIRPSFPPVVGGFPPCDDRAEPANARILELLKQRIPMRFPTKTPLEALLKHVREATLALDGKGIPIFVDPIGLQEAEKNMTSTVVFDVEDVPLQTGLHVCLQQLGLAYRVKDGFLQISCDSEWESQLLPSAENPFVIVGHCLLSVVAAAIGAVAAPIVAGRRENVT
jgi:hypothetical protein